MEIPYTQMKLCLGMYQCIFLLISSVFGGFHVSNQNVSLNWIALLLLFLECHNEVDICGFE